MKVKVYAAIPYKERTAMVLGIVDFVFKGKDDVDQYTPSSLEFAKRYMTIKHYTDLEMPSDLDEAWLVLNHTTIYDDVVNFVGDDIQRVFEEASKSIEARVHYMENKTDMNRFLQSITKMVELYGVNFKGVEAETFVKALKNIGNMSQQKIVELMQESGGEKEASVAKE